MSNEEIKVGEYVRTKHYGIKKIVPNGRYVEIDEGKNRRMYYVDQDGIPCEWEFAGYIWSDDILKHSLNIIDLIEVGDYVNGIKIISIIEQADTKKHIELCGFDNDYLNIKFDEIDIKDIVTKEQFNQVKYEV